MVQRVEASGDRRSLPELHRESLLVPGDTNHIIIGLWELIVFPGEPTVTPTPQRWRSNGYVVPQRVAQVMMLLPSAEPKRYRLTTYYVSRRTWISSVRRGRPRLCGEELEVAPRPIEWSNISQRWVLVCRAANDMSNVCVVPLMYVEHVISRRASSHIIEEY